MYWLIALAVAQDCPSSWFFDGQKCAPCRANCRCSTERGCDLGCLPGFTFDINLTACVQCPAANSVPSANAGVFYPACTDCCSQVIGTAVSCSKCDNSTGFAFMRNGLCLGLWGCTNMSETDLTCLSCLPGHFPNQGYCQPCHSSCLTCFNSLMCKDCQGGYYSNPASAGGLCEACPSGCIACQGAACSACLDGWFLAGASCSSCPALCSACSSGSACTGCRTGYGLVSSACVSCTTTAVAGSAGCLACNGGATLVCTSCSDGYYKKDGKCVSCASFGAGVSICN
jgi:hypothetical protein